MSTRWTLWAAGAATALALALPMPAEAGRDCSGKPPAAANVARSMNLAERTQARLDASGAKVVVLARAGQNLDAYGVRWSHLGLAYRAAPGQPWRVLHKLNACGAPTGALYRQGLGNFFLDDLYRYEAAYVVPDPEVQSRLLPVLLDDAQAHRLETPAYSMVAYAWSTRYQQSNQWALETLAGVLGSPQGLLDRTGAQGWLREHDYTPARLQIGTLQRLGARMTAGNIAFDDHPSEKRFAGRIETVTVDSVFDWLARSGHGAAPAVVR